jgi:hypothetical protein
MHQTIISNFLGLIQKRLQYELVLLILSVSSTCFDTLGQLPAGGVVLGRAWHELVASFGLQAFHRMVVVQVK